MSKNKNFKTVVATLIVMLIVLATFSYIVLKYLAPAYQLNQDKIYYYAIRLFPLLVGIILITIASILLSHGEDKEDEEDRLPPNSYDKDLFEEPCDDPESSKTVEVVETSKNEEVPFVSIFGEDTSLEKENSCVAIDNASNKALIDAIKTLADKIDSFSTPALVYPPKSVENQEETIAEPEPAIEAASQDESDSMIFKNYEGSEAHVRTHAEFDNAVKYGYNLTLAIVDGSIGQVALSIGDNGTCLDVNGKTLVIIPFEDEFEVSETLDKLNLKYEIRVLQEGMSFDNFIEGLL